MTTTGYAAAMQSVALGNRSDRVRIELTGPDRAKVLHNLTTNDIKRLAPGTGCEAFLTSGQGRTLALLTVHAEAERLLLRSDPGTAGAILGHLGKYGMFEDATARDVSAETSEWHLFGPRAREVVESLGFPMPETDLGILPATIPTARVIVDDPTGLGGLTIVSSRDQASAVAAAIRKPVASFGGAEVDPEVFDALRIEAGTAVFGRDVTEANLPQEINRDARAISFVKGCYLGQETVARLDAMGHVNKILIGAVAEGDGLPPAGASLEADGKPVGTVTSSAYSPAWSRGVVLGFVKTVHASPGSTLVARWEGGGAGLVVHACPMRPSS